MRVAFAGLLCLLHIASISVGAAPLAVGENVLENPSFEEAGENGRPTAWSLSNLSTKATWAFDTEEKHDGKQSLRITGNGVPERYAGLMYGNIIHLPGPATYRLSFWCKTKDLIDAEDLGSTGLLWHWVYPGDKVGGQRMQSLSLGVPNGTSDWTLYKAEVTVPCPVTLEPGNWQAFNGTVWLDDVRIEKVSDPGPSQTDRGLSPTVLAAKFPKAPRSKDKSFAVLCAPPVKKITRKVSVKDGAISGGPRAHISLAQGEHEAVQLILAPLTRDTVRVEFQTTYTNKRGRKEPPYLVGVVSVRPVGYTGFVADGRLISEPWPDPLLEDQYVQLEPDQLQPLWVDIFGPYLAEPGEYETSVTFTRDGKEVLTYPIDVTIYDFALPMRPTLPMTISASCPPSSRMLMSHRIGDTYLCLMRPPFGNNDRFYEFSEVKPVIEEALKYVESYGGRTFFFEMPRFPGTYAGGSNSIGAFASWMPSYNQQQRDYIVRYHREYANYLRERGLLGQTMAYLYDEPEPKTFPLIKDLRELLRTAAPDLKCMVVGHLLPELAGSVDVWCPTVLDFDSPEKVAFAKARKKLGEKVWAYNADGPPPPYTAWQTNPKCDLLSTRLNFWIVYKLGIDGFLHWTCDTNADLVRVGSGTDCYLRAGSGAYAQGAGQLLFFGPVAPSEVVPGKEIPHDKAISTIRLEAIRDGLEDHDYFVVLKTAVEQAKRRGVKPETVRTAEALLRLPDSIVVSFKQYTADAGLVMGWRDKVAKAIETLNHAPATVSVADVKQSTRRATMPSDILITNMKSRAIVGKPAQSGKKGKWNVIDYALERIGPGRAMAADGANAGPLTVRLGASGRYRISFVTRYNNVRAKLTGDADFDNCAPVHVALDPEDLKKGITRGSQEAIDSLKEGWCDVEEVFWREDDLTGKDLIIDDLTQPCILAIRLRPVVESPLAKAGNWPIATTIDSGIFSIKRHESPNDLFELPERIPKENNVKLLCVQVGGGDVWYANFTKEGTEFGKYGFPVEVGQGETNMIENIKSYRKWGINPMKSMADYAHKRGWELHVYIRLRGGTTMFTSNSRNATVVSKFYAEHPEYSLVDRDGTRVEGLSIAFPQVRKHLAKMYAELAARGVDGVNMCFIRGCPLALYEKPMVDGFKKKYRLDPRNLREDDPRWLEYTGNVGTAWMREIKKAIGLKCKLSAMVDGTLKSNRENGLDIPAWVKGGLVSDLILTVARRDKYGLSSHGWPQDLDYVSFQQLPGRENVRLWPMFYPWQQYQAEPERYHAAMQDYVYQGADGYAIWDGPAMNLMNDGPLLDLAKHPRQPEANRSRLMGKYKLLTWSGFRWTPHSPMEGW